MLADKEAMATVPVKSLAKARPFYEKTLGLHPEGGTPEGTQRYRTGDSTILVYESAFAGTNQATTLSWRLGDELDPVMADLKRKGVKFEHHDIPGATLDGDVYVAGDMRAAWFKDPDGNIINISSD